jgi:putative membrane protein
MKQMICSMNRCLLTLFILVSNSVVFAAEPMTPQPSWPGWHESHSHSFWWIFPLMFFVLMIVVCIFMMRRGCMGCMWRGRMMDRKEVDDAMKRSRGDHSESALEILDKRYARGEIDKQEYEEKKAAITVSTENSR